MMQNPAMPHMAANGQSKFGSLYASGDGQVAPRHWVLRVEQVPMFRVNLS
jgi:hypothetical protein